MGESDEAPPAAASPGQFQLRPVRPRLLTVDRITATFTVVLALATLALVVAAIFQHFDTVDAVQATNRLAVASENAAKDRRQTASAELILKLDAMISEHRYDRITEDIQSHDGNYHLPKYKNRTDADVEEYIGIFEDMGYFIKDNLITAKMAYDHFSYGIEKHGATPLFKKLYARRARPTEARPRKVTRFMGISRN